MLCPCWIGEDPDLGDCRSFLAYHISSGRVQGIDVSGLSVVAVCYIPGNVLAGNWEVVVLVDDKATPEQKDALVAALGGALGGPLADLAQLFGVVKGVESVPITHEVRDGVGTLAIPGVLESSMAPYRGADGSVTTLRDSDLLDGARLARLGVQGGQDLAHAPGVRHGVGVRGTQRDPVRVEDGVRRVIGTTAARASVARTPRVLWAAIGVAWAVAIAAQVTGNAALVHHDTLEHSGLPLWMSALLFVVAWQLMIAAMMLPSSLPMIRTFRVASSTRPHPERALGALIAGYAAVWSAFGLAAFIGDMGLHRLVHDWGWLGEHEYVIAGSTLLLAGAFQFSDLKDRCLSECRHPGTFLMQHYGRGSGAAWRLGARARPVLRRVLLGADAGRVRRRGREPVVDGRADGGDGRGEDGARGRALRPPDRVLADRARPVGARAPVVVRVRLTVAGYRRPS